MPCHSVKWLILLKMTELENKEGGQKNPQEAPVEEPVKKNNEEKKPDAEAGQQKKDEDLKDNSSVEALKSANKALETAEKTIVSLKRELKKTGRNFNEISESNPDIATLQESITSLREEIEILKTNKPSEEDTVVKELQETRKKLTEVSAALLSKNTAGKGDGEGGNKNPLMPIDEPKPLARTPAEIAILARRGLDKYGKKIKQGS